MGGFQVTVDDAAVQERLNRIEAATGDLSRALDETGIFLVNRIRRQFDLESAPGGGRWTPLKRHRDGRMLQLSQRLHDSITSKATSSEVVIGTNVPYAAIHQFGGKTRPHVIRAKNKQALAWPGGKYPVRQVNHPGSKVPARPYMLDASGNFPADWLSAIVRRLEQHLAGAAR